MSNPFEQRWNPMSDAQVREIRERYYRNRKDVESRPLIITACEEDYIRDVDTLLAEVGRLRLFIRDKLTNAGT